MRRSELVRPEISAGELLNASSLEQLGYKHRQAITPMRLDAGRVRGLECDGVSDQRVLSQTHTEGKAMQTGTSTNCSNRCSSCCANSCPLGCGWKDLRRLRFALGLRPLKLKSCRSHDTESIPCASQVRLAAPSENPDTCHERSFSKQIGGISTM